MNQLIGCCASSNNSKSRYAKNGIFIEDDANDNPIVSNSLEKRKTIKRILQKFIGHYCCYCVNNNSRLPIGKRFGIQFEDKKADDLNNELLQLEVDENTLDGLLRLMRREGIDYSHGEELFIGDEHHATYTLSKGAATKIQSLIRGIRDRRASQQLYKEALAEADGFWKELDRMKQLKNTVKAAREQFIHQFVDDAIVTATLHLIQKAAVRRIQRYLVVLILELSGFLFTKLNSSMGTIP